MRSTRSLAANVVKRSRGLRRATCRFLFDLAPNGVCHAIPFTGTRWSLTPPFHPYPEAVKLQGGLFSVALSFLFDVAKSIPIYHRDIPPCGVRTFLSSHRLAAEPERPITLTRRYSKNLCEYTRLRLPVQQPAAEVAQGHGQVFLHIVNQMRRQLHVTAAACTVVNRDQRIIPGLVKNLVVA